MFKHNRIISLVLLLSIVLIASCHRKVIPNADIPGNGTLHTETGFASYYADKFIGHVTASGEIYVSSKNTAAHKQLSFGTIVKVTNLTNNKSVLVKVNDRGPFAAGRIIDLSKSAAASIDMITTGIVKVTIQYRK